MILPVCSLQLVPEQGEKPMEHGDLKERCDDQAEDMVRKVNMQPVSGSLAGIMPVFTTEKLTKSEIT